jgi:hypothetical protein
MVIGGLVSLDGTASTTPLQASAPAAGGNIGGLAKYIAVAPGTIDAVTANTNATLAFRFLLSYIPLEGGNGVVTST